jgi:hypothetical protein
MPLIISKSGGSRKGAGGSVMAAKLHGVDTVLPLQRSAIHAQPMSHQEMNHE